jgi:RNA polymerase sigma-70 factor (ECF subfamily)
MAQAQHPGGRVTGAHLARPDTGCGATHGEAGTIDEALEAHRGELTAHCRRMLGSGFEADDAVQETMVRAWRHLDSFEGRSSLRSWLYRIATNVCLDMQRHPERRARPIDPGRSFGAGVGLNPAGAEPRWIPSGRSRGNLAPDGEPAELAASREAVRLAFAAALQLLPPRQRAVMILRDVLRWQASEVAELLDTTVASVNSALQRARATLKTVNRESTDSTAVNAEQRVLLARYVDAFERYDVASLVSLVRANS